MNRLLAGISTAAASAALIAAAPLAATADTTTAAPAPTTCDDTTPSIPRENAATQVAVGTTKVKTLELAITTLAACEVTKVTAVVQAPRRTTTVTLRKVDTDSGVDYWRAGLRIDPATLRNSDAGVWPTRYTATGAAEDDAVVLDNQVLRASRISFNAGPEPVRHGRLTYAGRVERASWNTDRYVVDPDRRVEVGYQPDPHEGGDVVARLRTGTDGRYRASTAYPGPGSYDAEVLATPTTAGAHSRHDEVTTKLR